MPGIHFLFVFLKGIWISCRVSLPLLLQSQQITLTEQMELTGLVAEPRIGQGELGSLGTSSLYEILS